MLESFYFADCMLLDFTVAPDLSTVQILSEVQYVSDTAPEGKFGQIKIRLANVRSVELKIMGGFHRDLDFPVGNKGNEIYDLLFDDEPDGKLRVTLRSDLLLLTATCPKECFMYVLMS